LRLKKKFFCFGFGVYWGDVTSGGNFVLIEKKHICADYSETANKFTHLDPYPLLSKQSVSNINAQYNYYSSIELRIAYHEVSLLPKERKYTAFEANGQLCQFRRLHFRLRNAVPCLQRVINDITAAYNCKGTFAYFDDITAYSKAPEEQDQNLFYGCS